LWSDKGCGLRTYLSWTRNPQSFADCIAGDRHDLEEGFAGAQCRELVRRDGPGTVAVNETRVGKRHGRAAEECAPSLLIFRRALAEGQSNGGVLGDLLGQAGIHASQVGQSLRGEDAHHAGFARAGKQRDDVPTLAPQSGELVNDDEAGAGSLCRDTHQVEQDPGAELCRERRVRCGVQAEEDRSSGLDCILEGQAVAEVLPGDPFDHETKAGPEAGDALALELAEAVHLTAESGRLRCAELAQQI
jgi:hypothetical protein